MRPVDDDRYRPAFPNPDRPTRWPGEQGHFRSSFQLGDVVRVLPSRVLGRIFAYDNTWSHLRGGRIVHLEPVLAHQAPEPANVRMYHAGHVGCWERDLAPAQPGDVSEHLTVRDGCQPWDYANGWRTVPATWERPPIPPASHNHPPAADAGHPDDRTAHDDRHPTSADGHADSPPR
jgi:hypothetical protein